MHRPLIGHALGTTPEAKANIRGSTQAAHNFYAEILIETGILGLVFFLRFLAKVYSKFRSNLNLLSIIDKNSGHQFYRHLNQALIAVFWMYVVYSTNYWGLSQYYWYLFAGLVLVFSKSLSEQLERPEMPGSIHDVEITDHSLRKSIPTVRQRMETRRLR
jgi:O-antigen ligase